MERDVIKTKLEEIWNRTNEHQGIKSVDVFKEVYGYDYDRETHIGQFNPISYFLTRKVKMGDAFKNYKYGRYSLLYVKKTGVGNKDLIDKFIHVFIYNMNKFFNPRSFQRAARLTWELKKDESALSKKFIDAAKKVGWIKTSNKYTFRVREKPTREIRNQIERILNSRTSPLKDIILPVISRQTELKVIVKEDVYNGMLSTIEKQIVKITDLERLKAELLDENQSMSSELRRREHMTVVNPEALLATANAQL